MLRIILSVLLIAFSRVVTATETAPAPNPPGYVLPERDVRQNTLDQKKAEVEMLRLEAEEAELRQRIAKATGDTSTPTTAGVPLLTAILVTDRGQVAYFKDGKRTVKARVGDHVGPWIVRAFLGNAVRLEHGDSGSNYLAAIGSKSPEAPVGVQPIENVQ